MHIFFSYLSYECVSPKEKPIFCANLLPCKSLGIEPSFSFHDRNNGKSHFLEIPCVIIAHLPEKAGIRREMNLFPSLKAGYTDMSPDAFSLLPSSELEKSLI